MEVSDYQEEHIIRDLLLLGKQRLKCFKRKWDNHQSSDAASESFDEHLAAQGDKYGSDGDNKVAVPDIPRIRVIEGRGTRNIKTVAKDGEDDASLGRSPGPSEGHQ